jgi:hypothetical protein
MVNEEEVDVGSEAEDLGKKLVRLCRLSSDETKPLGKRIRRYTGERSKLEVR